MNEIVCIRCDAYLKKDSDQIWCEEDIVFCQACAIEDEDEGKDN